MSPRLHLDFTQFMRDLVRLQLYVGPGTHQEEEHNIYIYIYILVGINISVLYGAKEP